MARMRQITTIFICIFSYLICQTSTVYAVWSEVSIADSDGTPIAGQTLLIIDMTTKEEIGQTESDDEGMIYFEFPNRGAQYAIVDQSGKQLMLFKAPFLSTWEWVGAGAGVVAIVGGVGLAVSNDDNGSGGSESVPTAAEITGNYSIYGPKTEDSCNKTSQTEISSNRPYISVSGSTITIRSSANMTGTYPSSGAISVSGTMSNGTVESFQGTVSKNSSGIVTIKGTLTYTDTDGCSRSYEVTYTKR